VNVVSEKRAIMSYINVLKKRPNRKAFNTKGRYLFDDKNVTE